MTKRFPWSRILIEGGVIVGSILLAFGIEAGWSAQQEAGRERDLAAAVRLEFEATRTSLEAAIGRADWLIDQKRGFLEVTGSRAEVPRDSLELLFDAAFRPIPFEPALSTYDGARATGQLGAVQTPMFLAAMTRFDLQLGRYERLSQVFMEMNLQGQLFELAKEVGTVSVLIGPRELTPPRLRLSDSEYRALVERPDVYATVETVLTVHQNVGASLRAMNEALEAALAELDGPR